MDYLDVGCLVEAVHLVEEFEEDALHFAVRSRSGIEALGGDGVDLVDEDDAWAVLLRHSERVSHHSGS